MKVLTYGIAREDIPKNHGVTVLIHENGAVTVTTTPTPHDVPTATNAEMQEWIEKNKNPNQ